jgi:PAS domain S-box-containing protein
LLTPGCAKAVVETLGSTENMPDDRHDFVHDEGVIDSEVRLQLALTASGLGVWEWRLADNAIHYSPRACEICGFAPDHPVTLEMVKAATHPDDRGWTAERARQRFDPALRDQSPYEYRVLHPDGTIRIVRAHGKAVFVDNADGSRAVAYVGTLADVTETRRLEMELKQSEATLRLAMDAGRIAVWQIDLATDQLTLTPGLKRLLGFDESAEVDREEIKARQHQDDVARVFAAGRAALERGERHFEEEFRFDSPDGVERCFLVSADMTLAPSGQVTGVLGILRDITQHKAAEGRLRLLAREVDHRANNLLTVVQSTIALSKAPSADLLKEVLSGRVRALAQAHQLMSESRWEGADLRRIVFEELQPYALGDDDRVVIAGDPVRLSPRAAQSVAMAIHELATNAAKYGAFSRSRGAVRIRWSLQAAASTLRIVWTERGGPPVQPPSRKGLGSTIIQRALEQIDGAADFRWSFEGLECDLSFPIDSK